MLSSPWCNALISANVEGGESADWFGAGSGWVCVPGRGCGLGNVQRASKSTKGVPTRSLQPFGVPHTTICKPFFQSFVLKLGAIRIKFSDNLAKTHYVSDQAGSLQRDRAGVIACLQAFLADLQHRKHNNRGSRRAAYVFRSVEALALISSQNNRTSQS